ncbi:hypothetical protein Ocin01_04863, partial [Orchesella cincta]
MEGYKYNAPNPTPSITTSSKSNLHSILKILTIAQVSTFQVLQTLVTAKLPTKPINLQIY